MRTLTKKDFRASPGPAVGVIIALVGLLGVILGLMDRSLLGALFASANMGLGLTITYLCKALERPDRRRGQPALEVARSNGAG